MCELHEESCGEYALGAITFSISDNLRWFHMTCLYCCFISRWYVKL